MTEADMQEQGKDFQDYLISMLGALTFGAVAWAVGFGLVQGLLYGLEYFGIALPDGDLMRTAITVALTGIPILMGLFTAWRSYGKLVAMD